MSHVGRMKNLEPPRPLKSTLKQQSSHAHTSVYEQNNIDDIILFIENAAENLSSGQYSTETVNALYRNLSIYGPDLENISKDTLDRTFVIFRNASQDEQLNLMTRLTLLELIELRANSWEIPDNVNTYYKSKATNVEPETMNEKSLLGTSPTGLSLNHSTNILAPGELIRSSGKFPMPTKIPGKNYSKDEIVIRNADSGKVMGIKGRRVHMIEELSETIISFQRVSLGAKERLVQITGPDEKSINSAKKLIEDTIRRNASPVRLETSQDGSCSSLASSASDEIAPRNSGSLNVATNASSASASMSVNNRKSITNVNQQYVPNQNVNTTKSRNNSSSVQQHLNNTHGHGNTAGGTQNLLLHSFSTNDASLGEYKYTVNVGPYNIKITGDCFDLVRVSKLVLDDYFSNNEFLTGNANYFDSSSQIQQLYPLAHPVDSGVSLDLMSKIQTSESNNNLVCDDEVFKSPTEDKSMLLSSPESLSSSSNSTITMTPVVNNGLSRSKRSHFSRKESTPESMKDTQKAKDETCAVRIVHDHEKLIFYSKSPHSNTLPRDWSKICEKLPQLIRNKEMNEKTRFNGDKYLELRRQKVHNPDIDNDVICTDDLEDNE